MKIVSSARLRGLEDSLAEATAKLEETQTALSQEREMTASLKAECNTLQATLSKVRSGAEASGKEMLKVRTQYDSLKKEFELYRRNSMPRSEAEADMKEIKEMIAKVDDMKQHYERRIKHLRHALADAQALLADRDAYAAARELDVIDLSASSTSETSRQNRSDKTDILPSPATKDDKKSGKEITQATNWLEPLPD